jgi:hypothetical protein
MRNSLNEDRKERNDTPWGVDGGSQLDIKPWWHQLATGAQLADPPQSRLLMTAGACR